MKTLEGILHEELVRTREQFARLKQKRENDPQTNWIRETVAARLGMPKETSFKELVEQLTAMNEAERKEKLKGIVN